LFEGIIANDIGIEDEEGSVVFAENLLSELEWASSA